MLTRSPSTLCSAAASSECHIGELLGVKSIASIGETWCALTTPERLLPKWTYIETIPRLIVGQVTAQRALNHRSLLESGIVRVCLSSVEDMAEQKGGLRRGSTAEVHLRRLGIILSDQFVVYPSAFFAALSRLSTKIT